MTRRSRFDRTSGCLPSVLQSVLRNALPAPPHPTALFARRAGGRRARTDAESRLSSPHAPTASVAWADPARQALFDRWLAGIREAHALLPQTVRPASSDASFRRYLRVDAADGTSRIVMDAPPAHNDLAPFVEIAAMLQRIGLHAPQVLHEDRGAGFLLLTDLGDTPYLGVLQRAQAAGDLAQCSALMHDAIAALVAWQTRADATALPPYDDALLRRELALFPEWCVQREYGAQWSAGEQAVWDRTCDLLVDSALAQPRVPVHRDYMPRNLMVCEPNPGVLDFQDAVRGPASYDIASLLRDAFVSWDEEQEIDWAVRYWQAARPAGVALSEDFGEFWRQLEWMGLQRHLKVLGIFCRLKHRDAKPHYSTDLPRFFAYAHKTATRYAALRPLAKLLEPLMGAQRVTAFY
jgi:aminoglycoside/choline kinase family phosphotransferase